MVSATVNTAGSSVFRIPHPLRSSEQPPTHISRNPSRNTPIRRFRRVTPPQHTTSRHNRTSTPPSVTYTPSLSQPPRPHQPAIPPKRRIIHLDALDIAQRQATIMTPHTPAAVLPISWHIRQLALIMRDTTRRMLREIHQYTLGMRRNPLTIHGNLGSHVDALPNLTLKTSTDTRLVEHPNPRVESLICVQRLRRVVKPHEHVQVRVPGSLKLENPVIMEHPVAFHELKPPLQPSVEHGRAHVGHLLRRHGEGHERGNTVHMGEVNLLQALLITPSHIPRPAPRLRPLRRLEGRQLHYLASVWVYQRLITRHAHAMRSNTYSRHNAPFGILKKICAPISRRRRAANPPFGKVPRTAPAPRLLVLWCRGSRPSRRSPSLRPLPSAPVRLRRLPSASVRSRAASAASVRFRPLPSAWLRLPRYRSALGLRFALTPTPALPSAPVRRLRLRSLPSLPSLRLLWRRTLPRHCVPPDPSRTVSETLSCHGARLSQCLRGRANVPSSSVSQSASPATVASNVLGASACLASRTGR